MNKKAFTLIEVIVAAFILATVLAGLVGVFVSGKKHIQHVRYRDTAVQLSKYFLDVLYEQVSQESWATNCLGASAGCPGTKSMDNVDYTPGYTRNYNSPINNVNRVVLQVSWNEPLP